MTKLTNPTEIARETLKQLAIRRILPSPDHYEAIYHEIAQTPDDTRLHPGFKELVTAFEALPMQSPTLSRQISQIRTSISAEKWGELPEQIFRVIHSQNGQTELTKTWSDLIRELILQWDLRNPTYPPSRKKDALEKVLLNFKHDSSVLNEKLSGLINSWAETGVAGLGSMIEPATNVENTASSVDNTDIRWQEWRDALAQALEFGLSARLLHNPELQSETSAIAQEAKAVDNPASMEKWLPRLRKFWLKLELENDNEQRLCDGLMGLLRLLTDNIASIVVDDDWVRGQIAVVQHIMAQPLDMRVIYEAEMGLKEVLFKQSQVKHSLVEAQTVLKTMLTSFIDRLGVMSESTDKYHDKINQYAEKIDSANDLTSIRHVMEDLLLDTRSMQLDVQRSRDDLFNARKQADEAHSRVVELEQELSSLSDKVRSDQLTGALNRRGLEEAYEVEAARAVRNASPLTIALLDIDNFKKLNDTQGHAVGDRALVHLVQVVKDLVRPTDSVARYGGEEFIVLMPDTDLEAGVQVMQRVQRELTRRFFTHNNEKVLITFSAGVALFHAEDTRDAVIERADQAMYIAKKSGKNRVETMD
ncbi:GGDEF domain-containing protein [Deefgea salmonis]|uniref:diguanylate cyclase n=1 Tax=Deefgea salmonis TaxID=2875502 RepID=A0ABS8BH34_9NEIS|nr:GGDEF domain-containing protein [Deefgea salmonis]MCB5195024.1 GGDEF domain-containing protein [Deefgea salmonis]